MAYTDTYRKDMYLLIEGKINYVEDRQYKTQGRQGGLIILRLKNIETGNSSTITVKSGYKMEEIIPEMKEVQFLYTDDDNVYVMDMESYETITAPKKLFGDYLYFLKEGEQFWCMIFEGKIINLKKNVSVKLKVTESVDAVKGNTANTAMKLITTETGYKVNVPLFVKTGDVISINTETGQYTGRE